jgi:hypothetical protein
MSAFNVVSTMPTKGGSIKREEARGRLEGKIRKLSRGGIRTRLRCWRMLSSEVFHSERTESEGVRAGGKTWAADGSDTRIPGSSSASCPRTHARLFFSHSPRAPDSQRLSLLSFSILARRSIL